MLNGKILECKSSKRERESETERALVPAAAANRELCMRGLRRRVSHLSTSPVYLFCLFLVVTVAHTTVVLGYSMTWM